MGYSPIIRLWVTRKVENFGFDVVSTSSFNDVAKNGWKTCNVYVLYGGFNGKRDGESAYGVCDRG